MLEQEVFPPDITIATMDITSLYTNMPSELVLQLLTELFEAFPHPKSEMLLDMIKFCLENNLMEFNGRFFLQIFGMAMGTPMAVIIANIFMSMLEKRLKDTFHSQGINWPLFYSRFIDDILLIFQGKRDYADLFLKLFNDMVPTIKCEKFGCIGSRVDFLDLTIYKGRRFKATGILDIKVYQKPLNAYLYIPFSSDHPTAMFKSFVVGELKRYVRNSSSKVSFLHMAKSFFSRLLDRGYPKETLKIWFEEIQFESRSKYLQKAHKDKQKVVPLKFIFDRKLGSLKIGKILKKNAEKHQKLHYIFSNFRPLVCMKKGKTLGNLLVRANLSTSS
jgi:hypothetical protein